MLKTEILWKIKGIVEEDERFYAVLAWDESYEMWFRDFFDSCAREDYELNELGAELPEDYQLGAVTEEKPERFVIYKGGLPEFIVVKCKRPRPDRHSNIGERKPRRRMWWLD